MSQDKIFCGSGKKREFNNGGSITQVMFNLDVLNKYFEQYGFTTDQGKKMIKVDVATLRNGPDQYGKTHSVSIDTWKPDNQQQQAPPSGNNQGFQDDPPF